MAFPAGKTKHKGKIISADKAQESRPGLPLDKEKIKELLIKYYGNVTKVSVALKCSRYSITRIIATDPEIKKVLDEARERVVDEVEDAFTARARKGDTTAAIFFLKTRARNRGYDQDFRADIEGITRAAMTFALNKSKNPAEPESKSDQPDPSPI